MENEVMHLVKFH
jgi:hypothetical protein